MMRRRWFFGLLPAAAAAQTTFNGATTAPVIVRDVPARVISAERGAIFALDLGKPANGECPACGAMAQKYVKSKGRCCAGGLCYPEDPPCDPDSKLIRCAHCSNAFWQDAEADDVR
jgi:hypothetical protein